MQYDQVYTMIIGRLQQDLPANLTYHNVDHTREVIEAAARLAAAENISGTELVLLKTAALFHDTGFLDQYENHETFSCNLARKYLTQYEYTSEQITSICQLIMATKIPQQPASALAQVLCDADLYYLGTDAYTANAARLFSELKEQGLVHSQMEWELKQVEFLAAHRYFTGAARAELDDSKQENFERLRQKPVANVMHHKKTSAYEQVQDFLLMLTGVVIAGVALKRFLVPNHFFDGGVTGISLLTHEIKHFNLAILIVLFNLPLVIISYFTVSRHFAVRTFISVVLLGTCLWLFPESAATSDKLLVSIFGGVFLGIGIGLVMRAGGALDGIEVLALYTLKRSSLTITEIILGINIIIFAIAAFKFGIETGLYSILTYFAATRTIDYVVEGLQAYTGVTIISAKSELIKYQLVNNFGRGITVYKGQRGFLPGKFEVSYDCDIIFTVITRLELRKLKNLIADADPHAFVFASTIKEASGGITRRKKMH